MFPSSKNLFQYRDVVACARSLNRVIVVLPASRLAMLTGQISGHLIKMVMDSIGCNGADFRVHLDNDLAYGVLLCAVTTSAYLDVRRRGFDIRGVRYEDLLERPLDMCCVLMEFCRLPVSLAELAVKAMDFDSQRNSISSRASVGQYTEQQLPSKTKEQLNKLLTKYGLPLIGDPNILDGTLSCS